jgi:integrase
LSPAKLITPAFVLALVAADADTFALAAAPETMMAQCRARAGKALRMRLPDIETKYEGQRVDGTHAVNGTAYLAASTKTFQCSFNRAGTVIVRFVVNR